MAMVHHDILTISIVWVLKSTHKILLNCLFSLAKNILWSPTLVNSVYRRFYSLLSSYGKMYGVRMTLQICIVVIAFFDIS